MWSLRTSTAYFQFHYDDNDASSKKNVGKWSDISVVVSRRLNYMRLCVYVTFTDRTDKFCLITYCIIEVNVPPPAILTQIQKRFKNIKVFENNQSSEAPL
jgi:hypothetical protein